MYPTKFHGLYVAGRRLGLHKKERITTEGKDTVMKKMIALALTILMLCAALTGCGQNGNPPAGSGSAAPGASGDSSGSGSSSSSGGEAETLTVWCWDESFNIAAMRTAEKYYREAGHENFTLNIVNTIEEDVQTKLSTAFSAKVTEELPDIVLIDRKSTRLNSSHNTESRI